MGRRFTSVRLEPVFEEAEIFNRAWVGGFQPIRFAKTISHVRYDHHWRWNVGASRGDSAGLLRPERLHS